MTVGLAGTPARSSAASKRCENSTLALFMPNTHVHSVITTRAIMLIKFYVEFHSISPPSCPRVIPVFSEFKPLELADRAAVEAAVHSFPSNRKATFL